jgi:hypothetical protein
MTALLQVKVLGSDTLKIPQLARAFFISVQLTLCKYVEFM